MDLFVNSYFYICIYHYANMTVLMIVNLFNIIVCILQNPTLNPLNLVVSGWKLMDPSELNYSDLQIPPGDKK